MRLACRIQRQAREQGAEFGNRPQDLEARPHVGEHQIAGPFLGRAFKAGHRTLKVAEAEMDLSQLELVDIGGSRGGLHLGKHGMGLIGATRAAVAASERALDARPEGVAAVLRPIQGERRFQRMGCLRVVPEALVSETKEPVRPVVAGVQIEDLPALLDRRVVLACETLHQRAIEVDRQGNGVQLRRPFDGLQCFR